MKKILSLCAVAMLIAATDLQAQSLNPSDLLRGGAEDGQKLVKAYTAPFFKGFSYGMNTGWSNDAKPLGAYGFFLGPVINVAIVPGKDQMFDINALKLKNFRLQDNNGPSSTPTAFGKNESGPKVQIISDDPLVPGQKRVIKDFQMPPGTGFSYVPMPTAQLNLGVGYGTEVMVRYIPKVEVPDIASIETYGGGVKHNIAQYIPALSSRKVYLSLMATYSLMNTNIKFDMKPDSNAIQNSDTYGNQQLKVKFDAWNMVAMISKTWKFFNISANVGFAHSQAKLKLQGNIPITLPDSSVGPTFGQNRVYTLKDPLDFTAAKYNGLMGGVAFTVKLGPVRIGADYTFLPYQVVSTKLGLGWPGMKEKENTASSRSAKKKDAYVKPETLESIKPTTPAPTETITAETIAEETPVETPAEGPVDAPAEETPAPVKFEETIDQPSTVSEAPAEAPAAEEVSAEAPVEVPAEVPTETPAPETAPLETSTDVKATEPAAEKPAVEEAPLVNPALATMSAVEVMSLPYNPRAAKPQSVSGPSLRELMQGKGVVSTYMMIQVLSNPDNNRTEIRYAYVASAKDLNTDEVARQAWPYVSKPLQGRQRIEQSVVVCPGNNCLSSYREVLDKYRDALPIFLGTHYITE